MPDRTDPLTGVQAKTMPELIEPMLARLSALPPQQSRWAFEIKWDGVRAIARSQPGTIRFFTRNRNDVTAAYPELRALNRALGSHQALLDGEIVAFDEQGHPSFQALQSRMHLRSDSAIDRLAAQTPVSYLIFDLLWLDGHPLIELPYVQRRERLAELKLHGERWRVPSYHVGEGSDLLTATREQGLEGLIAKRLDSRYSPGSRGGDWLKIKNSRRQEFVIGGWTEGKGARSNRLGALQLGVYDGQGRLSYAGRVGTGFDEAELQRLGALLAPLRRHSSPFVGDQPPPGAHFVKPELVCEVAFGEWTKDGRLRHPSYLGLREDKAAVEVVREREEPSGVTELEREEPSGLTELLDGGRRVRGGIEIGVQGRTLMLTNLDKVLYPSSGFAKRDLIDWYIAIAPVLLAHLRDRSLTLKRYPDGVRGQYFYEKQSPRHRPEWVRTKAIYSEHSKREVHYTLCQDLPTLIWLANLADIELHPSLSLAQHPQRPTCLVFDLDPGPPADILDCCEIALGLRDTFEQLGLKALVKTSGSKGLQVYVPLNDPRASYRETKPFAHAIANLLRSRRPELVVAQMGKGEREGKVLIDWSQNDEHKTTVCVYSLRAAERPTVSTPLRWEELSQCLEAGDQALLTFSPEQVLHRVDADGDLFAQALSLRQQLPELDSARLGGSGG